MKKCKGMRIPRIDKTKKGKIKGIIICDKIIEVKEKLPLFIRFIGIIKRNKKNNVIYLRCFFLNEDNAF